LQGTDLAQFNATHWGQEPLAGASVAAGAADSCKWQELDSLLKARPDDVLVVAAGRNLSVPAPAALPQLHGLFAAGIGIAIRKAERHSTSLAGVCAEFAREVPGEQRVIVFATPARTHGFGWHYDIEDVFIVQTEGDKEYLFRKNTVADPASCLGQPDFSLYERETSPIMSCRLLPGDWLYIPRGFWHVAYAHRDSLSISIGVLPSCIRSPMNAHAQSSANSEV